MHRIGLVGCDHRSAPPSRLEQAAGGVAELTARLIAAKSKGAIAGALVLSTCNRVEVLIESAGSAGDPVELGRALFDPAFRCHDARDAACVERLLRIATGLESLVLGEEQILGQLARAFGQAEVAGLASRAVHMLRTRILASARALRGQVPMAGPLGSVAGLGVERLLAAGPRLGVLGAGETARLALEILQRRRRAPSVVINRTKARAEALAAHFGGTALSLEEFAAEPPSLDGLLCAVGSDGPLVTARHAAGLRVVVDLSQPSVCAPELRGLAGLEVVDLDALATEAVAANAAQRCAADDLAARVRLRAAKIWEELAPGRGALGEVVALHVECALAEVEEAFRGALRHVADQDRDRIREVVQRAARRHAHYHLLDLRQMGAR